MSRSLNKMQVIGHLGEAPEVRFTAAGNPIANMRVATSDTWKDAQGAPQERTDWHTVVIFGKLAEIAQQYLKKGSRVFLEGRMQTRKWQDQNGNDRYSTEMVIDMRGQMIMLDGKDGGNGGGGGGGQRQPQAPAATQQRPAAPAQQQAAVNPAQTGGIPPAGFGVTPGAGMDEFDEEVPF